MILTAPVVVAESLDFGSSADGRNCGDVVEFRFNVLRFDEFIK
jgi:hypothetical protein